MFSDKYGLTQAVLEGRKTMTRRIVPIDTYNMTDWKEVEGGNYIAASDGDGHYFDIRRCGNYGIGDVVAIAQSYKAIANEIEKEGLDFLTIKDNIKKSVGWNNKLFVRADAMPHHIKITDIKVEKLQDTSREDMSKEGIVHDEAKDRFVCGDIVEFFQRDAFAALIDKISGKGTWKSNPWVFCYEFELID